ncbi:DUF2381 family protein [Archangium violaceum]|uniref:DUF2381 family protein n=1 Tax=Archangium violaceum TaxID=83451 RepID=UPI00193BF5A4|nr:DUF2381 family protein [Archangium violaceum]QRK09134.1 DUF2381 family protein [Archangium violaceum]
MELLVTRDEGESEEFRFLCQRLMCETQTLEESQKLLELVTRLNPLVRQVLFPGFPESAELLLGLLEDTQGTPPRHVDKRLLELHHGSPRLRAWLMNHAMEGPDHVLSVGACSSCCSGSSRIGVDGTSLPFTVIAGKDVVDGQVDVFPEPESPEAVRAALQAKQAENRALRAENQRYRQEEVSVEHALATLELFRDGGLRPGYVELDLAALAARVRR